jgi:hypothetical protein
MTMRINKKFFIVGLMIAFALFFELAAHADEENEASTLTFSQPIQVPGQVLPAGTYLFRLVDTDSNQHMVQILNAKENTVYATLHTVTTERPEATDDTALAFADQGPGKPDVLLKWFYPGRLTGNEFVYSKQSEKDLAQDKQQTIEATQPTLTKSDNPGAGN